MESEILEPMPMEKMEYFCEEVLKRDWPNSIHVSPAQPFKFVHCCTCTISDSGGLGVNV